MSTTGSGDEQADDPSRGWPPRRARYDAEPERTDTDDTADDTADNTADSLPEGDDTRVFARPKRLDMSDEDDTLVPGQGDDTIISGRLIANLPPADPEPAPDDDPEPLVAPEPAGPESATAEEDEDEPAPVPVAAFTPLIGSPEDLAAHRPRQAARGLPAKSTPRRRHRTSTGFGRIVGLTVLGAVIPGSGLIAAGRRRAGGIVLAVFVLLIVGLAGWALLGRDSLIATMLTPSALSVTTVLLAVLAIAWVGVVIASHLALRPRRPRQVQRVVGGVLVGLLSFAVAAPMAVAARYSYDSISGVNTVFKADGRSATRPTIAAPKQGDDPWADIPRVNVLLLGGDSGADRVGTRTDTVMVASIDTKTGDTTLISLPRNTGRMPFPADSPLSQYYPNGFTDGDGDNAQFFLNAMYGQVPAEVPKDVLGKTDDLGADAMKLSVGEALGLKISYYVLIDFKGFKQLVNALGGVDININTYVAVGGNTDLGIPPERWLHPGADQHLDGENALWFARGRYGADDFQRMDRQRCVINAIIDKANPATLLTRYEKIVTAGKAIIKTDIPQDVLPMMVELGTRVQGGNVRSVVFKNGVKGFSSPHPDFDQMRARVKSAIGETKKEKPSSGGGASKSPSTTKTPSGTSSSNASSDDITDACAYQPSVAATAVQPR